MKPKLPIVRCRTHPGQHRSYIVCNEVIEGRSKARTVKLTTNEEMGEISCSIENHEHTADNCTLFCEACAIESGLLING